MVHFFIDFILIDLSFDLYLYVIRVSMETTDPTSGNLRVSERNNGDVAEFHDSVSASQSETKSGDARDVSIGDKSNARGASTTNTLPRNSHARDASASERSPRNSNRI